MVVRRFNGQVVKRMRRVPSGILLTFLASALGQRGLQLVVSQQEWEAQGSVSYEPGVSLADLRGSPPVQDPPTQ